MGILKMKKIIILGYTALNLGDDLFIKMLCSRYPKVEFYLFADKKYTKPFKSIPNLRIKNIIPKIDGLFNLLKFPFQLNFLRLYQCAKKMDGIIQIGGSIFMEIGNWRGLYKGYNWLADLNIPYFIIGSNFGPYTSNDFFQQSSKLFDKINDLCFRDSYSYELFSQKKNVRLAPDVVLTMPYNQSNYHGKIVFSVINLEHRLELNSYQTKYENSIINILKKVVENGHSIILMSFCELEGDDVAINRIYNQLPEDIINKVEIYNYDGNLSEAVEIIGGSRSIVSTRFHSMILALLYNKPFLPYIYSEKTLNFLNDISYDQIIAKINDLDSLDYNKAFNQLLYGDVYDISELRDKAEKQFEAADSFLLNTNIKQKNNEKI